MSKDVAAKVKVKVDGYSPVSNSNNHPTSHNDPHIHRTCSFISRLKSLESFSSCFHHGTGKYSWKYTRPFPVLPSTVPTYFWVEQVWLLAKAVPRSTTPQQLRPKLATFNLSLARHARHDKACSSPLSQAAFSTKCLDFWSLFLSTLSKN